jgi:hypothetical protein
MRGKGTTIPPDLATVIVATLREIQRQLARLEDRQLRIMRELDAMDRRARPYGDGARVPRQRSVWRCR